MMEEEGEEEEDLVPIVDSEGEEEPDPEPENDGGEEDTGGAGKKHSPRFMRIARSSVGAVMNMVRKKSDGEEVGRTFSERAVEDRGTVSGWIRSKITDITSSEGTGEVQETSEFIPADYGLEAEGDLVYCSACLEASDHRKEGRRRLLFVFPFKDINGKISPRLRSYAEFARSIPIQPLSKQHKNRKLSIPEKRRRQLVESLKHSTCPQSQIINFLVTLTDSDKHFLGMTIILSLWFI